MTDPVTFGRSTVTINASSEGDDETPFDENRLPGTIVLSIITIGTIFGNTLTILAFAIDEKLRANLGNWFIVNLSLADFLVGAVSLPLNVAAYAHGYWPFGKDVCRFWSTVDYIATIESVFAVLLISLDRYLLLTIEVRHVTMQTRKRVFFQCACSWILTCVIVLPLVLGYPAWTGRVFFDYDDTCDVEFLYDTAWTVAFVVVTFIAPLLTLVYLNGSIYYRIRKRAKTVVPDNPTKQFYKDVVKTQVAIVNMDAIQATDMMSDDNRHINASHYDVQAVGTGPATTSSNNTQEGPSRENKPGERLSNPASTATSSSYSDHREKRHRKAAKTLAVLVVVFFICWAPHNMAVVVDQLCSEYCVTEIAWDVVSYLLWINSTLNPILYGLFHPGFRQTFKKILTCKCVRRQY
ncbi:histamine H3 receptor-like [Ptychodera flava]|uniref:histamine H3 receptor-like n=1 Tax=Ptychodera flava TaxID=63121 RepID=UPI00396A3288